MKRAIRWRWLVFVVAILMPAALPAAWGAPPAAPETSTSMAGYLENVTFEKLPGKERVTLAVSKQSGVTVENQPGNAVVVRLENLFVPEGLRRPLGDAALANVVRVTPVQKSADGRSWVLATIELKRKVPYSVRQEGMNVLIDFNVTSLASAAEPVPEKRRPRFSRAEGGVPRRRRSPRRMRQRSRRQTPGRRRRSIRAPGSLSTSRMPTSTRRYSGCWPNWGRSASLPATTSRGR